MPKHSFVVKHSKDCWWVQREGKKSPESTHKKKDTAVRRGRSMARRSHGSLKIKGRNGKVQAKHRYAA